MPTTTKEKTFPVRLTRRELAEIRDLMMRDTDSDTPRTDATQSAWHKITDAHLWAVSTEAGGF